MENPESEEYEYAMIADSRTLYLTEFRCRVSDPVLFLTQVAGASRGLSPPAVADFIRNYFLEDFIQEIRKYTVMDTYSNISGVVAGVKADIIYDAFKQRGLEFYMFKNDIEIGGVSLPMLEKMEKEDPTHGLPLLLAIQRGNEDKVLEMVRTVEVMRASGRSPVTGWLGALIATPGFPQPMVHQQEQQRRSQIIEKLRELKRMLDKGLIRQEEYEKLMKKSLGKYKQEM
ncbi:hypothetical protein IMZ38_01605 [Thermosphaera chiliense]|uniref:SHOCT domain-containing protein n=1 Tax=Thermosphaera chiliense TaxID=3402707 RepID=A0A7M1USW0_9CREN|nr:SPFH domain-containing protein [Thermosphaera aggregans]QOR94657.1 hypothetical protein IMZ38_01605 [Thermosphaera aggregans]